MQKQNNIELFKVLLEKTDNGEPVILYTLIDVPGNTDLINGEKLLVCSNGEIYGTLDNDLINKKMVRRAEDIFKKSLPNTDVIEINLSEIDSIQENKTIKILEDSHFPQKKLIIFGGGHVSLPLVEIAKVLGYYIIVIDDREEFANYQRFSSADEVICSQYEDELIENIVSEKIDISSNVVVVTRGHTYDKLCLKYIINSKASYIGMIGSKSKVKQTFQGLLNEGISQESLEKIYSPIGLDLGGEKPCEIAISILAQIIALEKNGSGRPLKEVVGEVLK